VSVIPLVNPAPKQISTTGGLEVRHSVMGVLPNRVGDVPMLVLGP